jgi:hypothetical protein
MRLCAQNKLKAGDPVCFGGETADSVILAAAMCAKTVDPDAVRDGVMGG